MILLDTNHSHCGWTLSFMIFAQNEKSVNQKHCRSLYDASTRKKKTTIDRKDLITNL